MKSIENGAIETMQNRHTTAMEGGSANNASLHGCRLVGSLIDMTTMDGGNVDFASLHGCSLLDNAGAYCRGAKIYPVIATFGLPVHHLQEHIVEEQLFYPYILSISRAKSFRNDLPATGCEVKTPLPGWV